MTPAAIGLLELRLAEQGGVLLQRVNDGAFAELRYEVGPLTVQCVAEYGSWRANIRHRLDAYAPASFWLAALGGSTTYPNPPVAEGDLERLSASLGEVVSAASCLAPLVLGMAADYRRDMLDRLS